MAVYGKRSKRMRETLSKRVAKIQKQLVLRKPEVKTYQNRNTAGTFTYSGDIATPLTGIAQGYSDGTRVGDQLRLRNMRLKMLITLPFGTNAPTLNRVIVFQLKNNPDSVITVGSTINLLLDSTGVGTLTAPLSPYDANNRNAYRILYDKVFPLQVPAGAGTSASCSAALKYLDLNIKFPKGGQVVEYSPATGAITKNETYIMVISNTSSSQSWVFDSMTYYTDS